MNYATINIQKVTTLSSLLGRTAHNSRSKISNNIRVDKIQNNVSSNNDAYQMIKNRVSEIQQIRKEAGARSMRNTTVPAVEIVLGASGEWFEDKSRSEIMNWAKANIEWAKNHYEGKGKLVSFDIHFDETNPHIHLIFIPETSKVDKSTGKLLPVLSAFEFMGNKAKMNADRTSHADALNSFGLVRGRNYFKEGEKPPENTKRVSQLRREMAEMQSKLDSMDIEEIWHLYKQVDWADSTITRQYAKGMLQEARQAKSEGSKDNLIKALNQKMNPSRLNR